MTGIASSAVVERPDAELAAAGDTAAFTRLVAAHHADMTRLAYVVTGDLGMANDAVQSAWAIAWRKLRSVKDPARVGSWLVSIAVNEAPAHATTAAPVDRADRAHRAGTAGLDPQAGIARLDLVRALNHLSPDDRALLALRYVAGVRSR